jgi:hypothetical protein
MGRMVQFQRDGIGPFADRRSRRATETTAYGLAEAARAASVGDEASFLTHS